MSGNPLHRPLARLWSERRSNAINRRVADNPSGSQTHYAIAKPSSNESESELSEVPTESDAELGESLSDPSSGGEYTEHTTEVGTAFEDENDQMDLETDTEDEYYPVKKSKTRKSNSKPAKSPTKQVQRPVARAITTITPITSSMSQSTGVYGGNLKTIQPSYPINKQTFKQSIGYIPAPARAHIASEPDETKNDRASNALAVSAHSTLQLLDNNTFTNKSGLLSSPSMYCENFSSSSTKAQSNFGRIPSSTQQPTLDHSIAAKPTPVSDIYNPAPRPKARRKAKTGQLKVEAGPAVEFTGGSLKDTHGDIMMGEAKARKPTDDSFKQPRKITKREKLHAVKHAFPSKRTQVANPFNPLPMPTHPSKSAMMRRNLESRAVATAPVPREVTFKPVKEVCSTDQALGMMGVAGNSLFLPGVKLLGSFDVIGDPKFFQSTGDWVRITRNKETQETFWEVGRAGADKEVCWGSCSGRMRTETLSLAIRHFEGELAD